MTNEQILTKAMEKAIKNGWNIYNFLDVCEKHFSLEEYSIETIGDNDISGLIQFYFFEGKYPCSKSKMYKERKLFELIFSHSFVKAFWGEGKEPMHYKGKTLYNSKTTWRYHLQLMVLEEEPLKYIEGFL